MTLTEFLLARIADDEEMAGAASREVPQRRAEGEVWGVWVGSKWYQSTAYAALVQRYDPTRVLAECEAKRQLVADHNAEVAIEDDGPEFWTDCESCRQSPPCTTLRILGTIYADHPDYREEWRPLTN